jgi:hypothetical protein
VSTMRGFDAAQRAYDNMTPPDDGPYKCPECNGSGSVPIPGDPEGEIMKCAACDGFGLISENGEPFDLDAKDRSEADYADMKRDESLTTYRGGYDEDDEPHF